MNFQISSLQPKLQPKPLFLKSIGNGKSVSIGNSSSNWSANPKKDVSHSTTFTAELQNSVFDTGTEIQNFFCSSDLKRLTKILQEEADRRSKLKATMQPDLSYHELSSIISKIGDNGLEPMDRYYSLQKLHIFSLGVQFNLKSHQRNHIKKNANTLIKLHALEPLVRNLRVFIGVVLDGHPASSEAPPGTGGSKMLHEFISTQVDFILDTLWMMMVTGSGNEVFIQELASLEPFFASYLLEIIEKLAEGMFVQVFSLRKLTLMLYKVVELIVGGEQGLAIVKDEIVDLTARDWEIMKGKSPSDVNRKSEELPLKSEPTASILSDEENFSGRVKQDSRGLVKSDLQDIVDYRCLLLNRYPGYSFPDPPVVGFDAISPSHLMEKHCMQYSQYTTPDPTWSVHAQLEASRYSVFNPPFPSMHLPGTEAQGPPTSLREALDVFDKYYKPNASFLQVAMEKKLKSMNDNLVSVLGAEFGIKEQNYFSYTAQPSQRSMSNPRPILNEQTSPQLFRIRKLYQELYPRLSNHITVLVRLLFYLNVSSTTSFDHAAVIENLAKDWSSLSSTERLAEIGKRDSLRHKEIITMAISRLLVFITKAAKRYHILAFEHISFLLVDNSAPILILKMLSSWFANPSLQKGKKSLDEPLDGEDAIIGTAWLSDRPLPKELDFFHVCRISYAPQTAGQNSNERGEHASPNGKRMKVAHKYENGSPDYFPIDVGQEVLLMHEYDDGWVAVYIPTTGEQSICPLAALKEVDTNESDAGSGPIEAATTSSTLTDKKNLSRRNICTTKNLVSILQKLTKSKPNRLLALVQWKAQAVLKRMLKCPTQTFNKPILKLLKHQIPYLGKKWRANNIYLVSQIYMTVPHRLREDYLCGDGDTDPSAAQRLDSDLRELVSFYNSHLPFADQTATDSEISSPFTDTYENWLGEWSHDAADASILDDYDGGDDDDETWIEGLIVDEMGENGGLEDDGLFQIDQVFANPSFNMELLEEESLMNSFNIDSLN